MKFVNNGAAHWSIGVSASSATNNLNPFVITNTSDNGDVLWAGPFNPRFTFSTDGKFSIFTGTGGVTLKFRTGSSGLEIESPDGQDTRLFSNAVNTGINTTGSAPYASTYGSGSIATGTASFAEGVGTLASGFAAHAAGFNTTASATASFSTGIETDADGIGSFTAGSGSLAKGDSSVAMGISTIASASGQVTIGHFNFPLNSPDHLFVVGGGTGSATSARGNLLEVYGGIGSTYKAVKIDVGSTFTQTSAPPQGFSIYGNTVFSGNITGSVRVGGSNIQLNDDSGNVNATSSFTILDTDRITPGPDFNKLVIDRFGINFDRSNKTTTPGSKYLWTDSSNRLFYSSSAIILNDGNTLGATMTIGTIDTNNLQLETNNTTRVFISSSGNVGIGTATPSASLQIQGNFQISTGSLYTYGQNTDIDSGSFRTVMSISTGSYRAAFFDYVLTSGSNARAGTVFSVWQGTSVEYADTSTNDIGNTTGVNLLVSMSGANIGLFASSSNDNWSMKALARMI